MFSYQRQSKFDGIKSFLKIKICSEYGPFLLVVYSFRYWYFVLISIGHSCQHHGQTINFPHNLKTEKRLNMMIDESKTSVLTKSPV